PWACCGRRLAMTTEAGVAGGNFSWRALAALFARLRGAGPRRPTGPRRRPARVPDRAGYAALHVIRRPTQNRTRRAGPAQLLIDYTRTALAALLWRPTARRIGIVGLGGGSQVKFLHRHLPLARLEVVETHPGVIALRRTFGIPDDDSRLEVTHDDGARFIAAR